MGMNEAEYNLIAAALQERLDNEYPRLSIRVLTANEVDLIWLEEGVLVLELDLVVLRATPPAEAHEHLGAVVKGMVRDIHAQTLLLLDTPAVSKKGSSIR